jgi:pantoate--beta-alanine ligase
MCVTCRLLQDAGIDALFLPKSLYSTGHTTPDVNKLPRFSRALCDSALPERGNEQNGRTGTPICCHASGLDGANDLDGLSAARASGEESVGRSPATGANASMHTEAVYRPGSTLQTDVPLSDMRSGMRAGHPAAVRVEQPCTQGEQAFVVGSSPHVPGGHDTFVVPGRLQEPLCGKTRPHFFRGVATVVAKLFNIVEPAVAVFGKKDFQQLRVIQTMVRDLDFAVRIVGGDIVREPDGLATSSRNARLSVESRAQAPCIHAALTDARDALRALLEEGGVVGEDAIRGILDKAQEAVERGGGRVDYVELLHAETLEDVKALRGQPAVMAAAVFMGGSDGSPVRLIDNVEI